MILKSDNRKLPYLNIGCGERYHRDWTNIDIVSRSKDVIEYDITKGIPYAKNTFQVVYHSHVIEHIPFEQVKVFIEDCYRVLKPNGIIRIAFPDLESITRIYLQALENANSNPTSENHSKYHWIKLELLDQMVRNISGGQMKQYLLQPNTNKNIGFIKERVGSEATHIIEFAHQNKTSFKDKIRKFSSLSLQSKVRLIRENLRDKILIKTLLWGYSRKAYEIGVFRTSGEIHQWMYDRYSIKVLLESCNFKEVRIVDAFTSNIHNWNDFELDSQNGLIYKPDSLFVEAIK